MKPGSIGELGLVSSQVQLVHWIYYLGAKLKTKRLLNGVSIPAGISKRLSETLTTT
jgi:hypothetical protein